MEYVEAEFRTEDWNESKKKLQQIREGALRGLMRGAARPFPKIVANIYGRRVADGVIK